MSHAPSLRRATLRMIPSEGRRQSVYHPAKGLLRSCGRARTFSQSRRACGRPGPRPRSTRPRRLTTLRQSKARPGRLVVQASCTPKATCFCCPSALLRLGPWRGPRVSKLVVIATARSQARAVGAECHRDHLVGGAVELERTRRPVAASQSADAAGDALFGSQSPGEPGYPGR